MKSLITAASVAVLAAAVPALAQAQMATVAPGLYGTLGYSDSHTSGVDLGAIQGRLGYRFNSWLGVEGELAGGVKDDKSTTTVSGVTVDTKVKLKDEEAIYGVGFLPLSNDFDLLARIGYGRSSAKATASAVGSTGPISVSDSADGNSWNFGVGAQYHFDGKNGVRADYTRQEFTGDNSGHADVWALAYTRRF
jgi:opacity protein-like surface antigen